jgi:2-C-methyl-D-erythritol 4-phosphate cytidylyltransferase/2-C-methyl-D-erythritol 2,4-cyclodiphosphate synthase
VDFTDDAGVLEWAGYRVAAVQGDPRNFKITTLLDLARAQARIEGER